MGIQLVAGMNSNITYDGPSQPIEKAIASIKPYLIIIWVLREGVWYMYDPLDPIGSDLTYLNKAEVCWVKVTQDCYWSWEVAASKTGLIIGAAIAAVAIIGGVYLAMRKG